MKNLIILLFVSEFLLSNPLQEAIDNAKNGDIIELGSGVINGDVVISKPVSIIGNSTVINGSGTSSVIKIFSNNVILKNLKIQNSGNSHSNIDAGISCEQSNNILIENNEIQNSLFGIDFKQCNDSKILNNRISSKNVDLGLRGDAIRLWHSHNNKILNNKINKSRDLVIWYSSGNLIKSNIATDGRYSLHFMYAGRNLVENNVFLRNSVGVFFMFSNGSEVRHNFIAHSTGTFGVGIGMKDTSDFLVEDNILMYNARGLYLDNSPYEPGTTNRYFKNQILYNTTAIQLQSVQLPSIFKDNNFIGNIDLVLSASSEKSLHKNNWINNFYDEYEGFDRNKDGFGDNAFKNYAYADIIWQNYPNLKFFYASAAISSINFLSKLAPFSEPILLLKDNQPRIKPMEMEFKYE